MTVPSRKNQPMASGRSHQWHRDQAAKRNAKVLEAAISTAREQGFAALTREAVAVRAGVSVGSVNNVFGTVAGMKSAVMRFAIEHRILEVIAQGVALGDSIALAAPSDLKRRALTSLT